LHNSQVRINHPALATYAFVLWRKVAGAQAEPTGLAVERNQRLAGRTSSSWQKPAGRATADDRKGSIRIKVLLRQLLWSAARADLGYRIFERIYDATAHIPTHPQGWKRPAPRPSARSTEQQMQTA